MRILIWIAVGSLLLLAAAIVALQVWFANSVAPVEPFVPTAEEREQLAFYSQPESSFVEHLQGPREVVDGQTLDPKLQYFAETVRPRAAWAPYTVPVIFASPWGRAFVRHNVDRGWLLFTKETRPMAKVEDRQILGRGGPIPIRIYRPEQDGSEALPVLVYHHGGGWVFTSITALDRVSRFIANEAKVIVISVNYRLAPEHPYPAASDDGEDAFLWAQANAASLGGDPARVAAGGDSAGGHVAINIAQRRLAAGEPGPVALLLFYPGAGLPLEDPSYRLFGKGYGLDASFIEFILPRVFPRYRPGEFDDFMDPSRAQSLNGLPPTIIATAGFDILRDSGRRFAERLTEAGVFVDYANHPSLTHSFLQFSGVVHDAEVATADSARLLGQIIRGQRSDAASRKP